ncbi:TolC family protein [Fimbriiglobus ruber]|uniref:Outer membrane efflux protein n=1 Tax=Fimbriiglobus ruber TaxID=1908690 RepID=A0A225DCP3_9BACT|nr:TolC family protein [Fimbriiglobus ruber]OWK35086.1 hypothetical protein FRUB_09928 [Fimbriiglobus ruber]
MSARKLFSLWRPALQVAVATELLLHGVGCSRPFYRKQADKEVSEILGDKDKYDAWKIDNFHIYPDPQARFADPSDPDRPPKPPDDPAAYDLSPNPQKPGKAGVARVEGTGYLALITKWDKENREKLAQEEATEKAELARANIGDSDDFVGPKQEIRLASATMQAPPTAPSGPGTPAPSSGPLGATPSSVETTPAEINQTGLEATGRTSLEIAGRPTYRISLDQAAELAMFNSREYQDRRENLYLAALPVSQERFAFTSQLFAASEAVRGASGSQTASGTTNSWSINNGAGLSKVLPTGGLLLLNFANQTVFDFTNPKSTLSTTTLNFSALQPLLKGGGQAVALESLTQAERNLLYQIRTFARFRKELYVEIASNSGGSISGSSFQPTGILSNNGAGGGGLGGSGIAVGGVPSGATTIPGPILAPSSPGSLNLGAAITPAPAGYLNTMLQNIEIYIDKENISVLNLILQRYRGLLEGDVVGPLQVQSVEQQLLTGRANLLTDQQQYLDSIDSFKIELGVPTNLNIETDDSVLRPLMKQYRRSRAIIEEEQAAVMDASRLSTLDKAPQVRPELLNMMQKTTFVKGTEFAKAIRARLAVWEALSDKDLKDKLETIRQETQALLNRQAELQKNDKLPTPADQARLKALGSESDLGNYERVLRKYEADYVQGGTVKKLDPTAERRRVVQFRDVASYWQKILVEARDERWAAIRKGWPELPQCCVDGVDLIHADLSTAEAAAARHALANRFDLMNVRAQMVDAWRQLAVFANALLGTFTVQYNLATNSPLTVAQPTNIGGSGTTNQLVLNTQLPLVRIQERNNYRGSQIAYQRQRRALQEAEDLAVRAVRSEIHLLRVYAESYRIQQRQLELAYLTIDSSLEALQAPSPPGTARGGDGPAALTQQLLSAQRSLPAAQNALLAIWINYLDARLQLYRDLELMPLDARGVWIDEIRACDCGLSSELLPGGPPLPATGSGAPTPGSQQRLGEPRSIPLPLPAATGGQKRME